MSCGKLAILLIVTYAGKIIKLRKLKEGRQVSVLVISKKCLDPLIREEEHLQADSYRYDREEYFEPPHEPDYPFEALDFAGVLC